MLGKRDQQTTELQFFLPIIKAAEQEIADFKCRLDITFDVEVVLQIRVGQTDFGPRQEHSPECAGMFQHERDIARLLVGPLSAVPHPNADLLERAAREGFRLEHGAFVPRLFFPRRSHASLPGVAQLSQVAWSASQGACATMLNHAELHAPGFTDHVLIPGRVPNELDISFIYAVDGQNFALRVARDSRSHAAAGCGKGHFHFHLCAAVVLLH